MIFVTEDVCIGQLFDAYIFRMTQVDVEWEIKLTNVIVGIVQVATISIRDNPDDEVYVAGIK